MKGEEIAISSIVEEFDYTLLDLWASWCSPCIQNSKAMIPIYDYYKDKGFTIIGVAREYSDSKAMVNAINKYGFKWVNLLELNDENNIWRRYKIPSGAGGTFLLNRNGEIISINPTAEEVRKILAEELDQLSTE